MASSNGIMTKFKFPYRFFDDDGRRFSCNAMYKKSPAEFWLNLEFLAKDYRQFHNHMCQIYQTDFRNRKFPEPWLSIEKGDHCIFQIGAQFYRGEMQRFTEKGKVELVNVDTGEKIDSHPVNRVYPVSADKTIVRSTPMFALRCKFVDLEPLTEDGWSRDCIQFFRAFTKPLLRCEFLGHSDDYSYVKLYNWNEDCLLGYGEVTELLVCDRKVARWTDPRTPPFISYPVLDIRDIGPGDTIRAIVSHVDSPQQFFIQLERNEDLISKICHEIRFHYKRHSDKYRNVYAMKGRPCVARTKRAPYSGEWFRAKIYRVETEDDVLVVYSDYGNIEQLQVSEVKELKPEYLKYAPQAILCALTGVERSDYELKQEFKDVVENQRFECRIDAIVKMQEDRYVMYVTLFRIAGGRRYNINQYFLKGGPKPPPPDRLIPGCAMAYPYPDKEFMLDSDDEAQVAWMTLPNGETRMDTDENFGKNLRNGDGFKVTDRNLDTDPTDFQNGDGFKVTDGDPDGDPNSFQNGDGFKVIEGYPDIATCSKMTVVSLPNGYFYSKT